MPNHQRRPLHVNLDPDAYAGWEDTALRLGVTLTAFVSAIGEMYRDYPDFGEPGGPGDTEKWREATERAKQIDAERRKRRTD